MAALRCADAPISPQGLFGDAVSAVKRQSEAFKEFIPHRSEKPGPPSSLTCPPPDRAEKKTSVAAPAPIPHIKYRKAGQWARAQACQARPDLSTVISARGFHVLVHTDSTAVFAYMNHQSGLRSRPLCKLVQQILLWAETKLLLLRALFVPGHINREADFLSKQVLRPGEWWLHPQVVESVWQMYGRAEVDLFASEESTHCPLWYFFSAPLGLDALVQTWLRLRLYAFPLVALLPQVLARVHHDGVHLLLVAPRWPTRVWFSDLVSFLNGTPWEIPIRKDLLS
ncbi:hypothetical protein QTP70_029551 [Hemibagrus guttatus]|uniref:Uncharacterized protein n=1 Tax=Hemibagrus guttatus TaxID=175788 RepID=A0AAE0R362_9TELE|nr:hypothetical protein QTP70_029551 [Hemibagrus guttatus]